MKRISLIMGIISLLLYVNTAYGVSVKPKKSSPGCQKNLEMCTDDLDTCDTDLQTCIDESQVFPGDGYPDTDAIGLPGHGPALSYTDNGDTFTDDNTGCMWEKKLKSDSTDGGNCTDGTQSNRSVHCVNNIYTWGVGTSASDGTLFTVFLDTLNNKCEGNETTACTIDADCAGLCGHAGYRDWEIPNIKLLQSIVDYSVISPSSIVPGATIASPYWSSTTLFNDSFAWVVFFAGGGVNGGSKVTPNFARAVRPCS